MEEILNILGAKQPFEENMQGDLTVEGVDAYEKLIKIISLLNNIGAIAETVDQCEKYFDEIMRLEF